MRQASQRGVRMIPIPRVARSRGRGMGADSYFDQWCDSPISILDPTSFAVSMVGCLPRDISKTYTKVANAIVYDDLGNPAAPTPPKTALIANGGIDVLGNPTYDVTEQTPAEVYADWRGQTQAFFNNLSTPDPDALPSWVWWAGGLLAVGMFVLDAKTGGRR